MNEFEEAKILFIDGLKHLGANDLQAAEIHFTQSLELLPGRVSTLNNLSAVKNRLGEFAQGEKFAREAIALEDNSREAWWNLGFALTGRTRHEEALQAFDRALSCDPDYPTAWVSKAMALLELKRFEEALVVCDQAPASISSRYELLFCKSQILKELGRLDEALKIYLKSLDARVASSPVFISERRASQKADVLIINPDPKIDSSLMTFQDLHLSCSNFPRQAAELFSEEYRFAFVFDGNATTASARKKIPRPDLVMNNVANGERLLSLGKLAGLSELADSFGRPVVNHPKNVALTTRDGTAKLLENVDGILIPKTARFSATGKTIEELAREIEDQYDYPFITRTLFAQEGKWMTKVDSREELIKVLSTDWPDKFFVTQFVDCRRGKEFFRKIRATVVADEVIITRVDYSADWNVRGRKNPNRLAFYAENRHLLDVEKQICGKPEKALGRAAVHALEVIRDRIPLDVFGIDFDVNADGALVFYEANATMNLFSTAPKVIPNPKEGEDALKLAFRRYFGSLVGSQ
jgi:tetratricopeptide (TPR) repeat protein